MSYPRANPNAAPVFTLSSMEAYDPTILGRCNDRTVVAEGRAYPPGALRAVEAVCFEASPAVRVWRYRLVVLDPPDHFAAYGRHPFDNLFS